MFALDRRVSMVSLFSLCLNAVSEYLANTNPEHAAKLEGLQSLPSELLRAVLEMPCTSVGATSSQARQQLKRKRLIQGGALCAGVHCLELRCWAPVPATAELVSYLSELRIFIVSGGFVPCTDNLVLPRTLVELTLVSVCSLDDSAFAKVHASRSVRFEFAQQCSRCSRSCVR